MTGVYLPWAMLLLSVLLGNSPLFDLIGIGVGHLYYFLVDVLPRSPSRTELLRTPQLLCDAPPPPIPRACRAPHTSRSRSYSLLEPNRQQRVRFGNAPGAAAAPAPAPAARDWGRGHVLGR